MATPVAPFDQAHLRGGIKCDQLIVEIINQNGNDDGENQGILVHGSFTFLFWIGSDFGGTESSYKLTRMELFRNQECTTNLLLKRRHDGIVGKIVEFPSRVGYLLCRSFRIAGKVLPMRLFSLDLKEYPADLFALALCFEMRNLIVALIAVLS